PVTSTGMRDAGCFAHLVRSPRAGWPNHPRHLISSHAHKILFVYSLYFYVDLSLPWGNSDRAFNGRPILGANQE
ncbi:hypothetical protein, partial [Agrobacterium tumefaciens]|uniref:hypothetical protein n=1 Tax=Agrobacterium tumefaciens TaxID=358 RepID=UPI001BA76491